MKKIYLLHRKNSKTGIRMGTVLGWGHGYAGGSIPPEGAVVVRWGCTTTLPEEATVLGEVNKAEAISLAATKDLALLHLEQAGIPCLKVLDYNNVVLPALGRTRRHERGEGFFPCTTQGEVHSAMRAGADYFVALLAPGFKEYRVHCVFGNPIRVTFKKSPTEELRVSEPNPAMVKIALDAVKSLGLDFGAVDIVRAVDGKHLVLEVNTAPEVDGSDFPAWFAVLKDYEDYLNAKDKVDAFTAAYPQRRA